MVLMSPDIYQRTRQLLLGEAEKSALLVEFSAWLRQKYAVDLVNFDYGRIDNPNNSRRLYLVLNAALDVEKLTSAPFQRNPIIDQAISDRFRQLARKHAYADQHALEKFFVAYTDFSEEARTLANWEAIKEAKPLIKSRHPQVWELLAIFSSTVVFYYQDAEIQEHEASGLSAAIFEQYYRIIKKYDELDYYTPGNFNLKFDSKQNVDQNYEGSLFYYSR